MNALGRHDDALAIMRDVVERHPGLAVGWNMLGMTWHRLQADREALEAYQQAVRIDPTLVDAWSNGAQELARLERRDEDVEKILNQFYQVEGFLSLSDQDSAIPEHVLCDHEFGVRDLDIVDGQPALFDECSSCSHCLNPLLH